MPTAPTDQEPSQTHPELGDDQAPARRAQWRTTRDNPGPHQTPTAQEQPSEPIDDAKAESD